jgi:hypothetical protein
VEARLLELQQLLPVGIEMIPLFEQHRLVDRSIGQFLLNLTASITTVIAALCLFMGWRAGVMVGAVLLLTGHRHRRRDGRNRDRTTTDFAGRHDDRDGHAGRQRHRGD